MKTLTALFSLTLLLPCVLASGNVIWSGGDDDAPVRRGRLPIVLPRPVPVAPVRQPIILIPFHPPVKVMPYYQLRRYIFVDAMPKRPVRK